LPDGSTWFVELKTKGGRLSVLQKMFADEVQALNQNYACLWTKEQVDLFDYDPTKMKRLTSCTSATEP